MISLPAREGAATYALSSSPTIDDAAVQYGRFAYSADGIDMVPLIPLSGTVVVERSTTHAFLATFDLELESRISDTTSRLPLAASKTRDAGSCRTGRTAKSPIDPTAIRRLRLATEREVRASLRTATRYAL